MYNIRMTNFSFVFVVLDVHHRLARKRKSSFNMYTNICGPILSTKLTVNIEYFFIELRVFEH